MTTTDQPTEPTKPVYNPDASRQQSDEGHVMSGGKCPCGNDHEMLDRDKPRKAP